GEVTVLGPVELSGRLTSGTLGLAALRDVDAFGDGGERIGRLRAGAWVVPAGKAGGRGGGDGVGAGATRVAGGPAGGVGEAGEVSRWKSYSQKPKPSWPKPARRRCCSAPPAAVARGPRSTSARTSSSWRSSRGRCASGPTARWKSRDLCRKRGSTRPRDRRRG